MLGSEPELIFVFLPEPLGPMDRGDKYEDPIIEELERLGLGEVTGGGTGMGDERSDGRRDIQSCGIDVETRNVDATRAALRELLPKRLPTGNTIAVQPRGQSAPRRIRRRELADRAGAYRIHS